MSKKEEKNEQKTIENKDGSDFEKLSCDKSYLLTLHYVINTINYRHAQSNAVISVLTLKVGAGVECSCVLRGEMVKGRNDFLFVSVTAE